MDLEYPSQKTKYSTDLELVFIHTLYTVIHEHKNTYSCTYIYYFEKDSIYITCKSFIHLNTSVC